MDISTTKTIACIVPTEKAEERDYVHNSFIPHNITMYRVDQEYQLEMTVNNEKCLWKVDRDATELKAEMTKLVESALSGYEAACLSLSVSVECKGAISEHRRNNLKAGLDTLKTRLDMLNEDVTIEYAYIGVEDRECYDIRKGLPRSNITMIRKGIDSFMQVVRGVDDISSVIEDAPTSPFILNIKLTNSSKNTVGRLVIIDLLHPRFTPLLSGIKSPIHQSFDYLRYMAGKFTMPNCKDELKTSGSVLTNEITKYICGNCKVIVVGYINDKIANEVHSKETKALLSFLSSFKGIPIYALPNSCLQDTSEYKSLSVDIKKEKSLNDSLVSSNNTVKEQLSKKDITISRLELDVNQVGSEFTENYNKQVAFEERKALLDILNKQVHYLKATLASKETIYEFNKVELNADIVKLKSMLDIKEFAEDDLMSEMQTKKKRYQQLYLDLKSKMEASTAEVQYLEADLQTLHRKAHEIKARQPQVVLDQNAKNNLDAGHWKKDLDLLEDLTKDLDLPEDLNLLEGLNSQEDIKLKKSQCPTATLSRPNVINDERKRKFEDLESTYEKLREKLEKKEAERSDIKKIVKEDYEDFEIGIKRKLEPLKKHMKKEILGLKEMANNKMSALNRFYENKLADQEREIERLRKELSKVRHSKNKKAKN